MAAGLDASSPQWETEMRGLVKSVHIAQAVLGKGGRDRMTPRDWGRVGMALRKQYGFLGKFAAERFALSPEAIAARAGLYVENGTASFERAQAAAAGIPDLPQYPGDGQTECLTNCRCWLEIEESAEGYAVTWHANDDPATCDDCAALAQDWSPLIVGRED